MVLVNVLKDKIDNPSYIYEDSFGNSVDQSAIYGDVYFTCLKNKFPAIVLTPVCDISTKEVGYLTVAQIIPMKPIYEAFLGKQGFTEEEIAGVSLIDEKKKRKHHDTFRKQYLENRTLRYHFLPKLTGIIDHSLVNFEIVQTMPVSEFAQLKKIAVLKSPWKEAVPSRYAAYCLRIGTPDYSESLFDSILENVSSLNKYSGAQTVPIEVKNIG